MSGQPQEKIAVLGAGSWGTALAKVLVENGHDVMIWSRVEDKAIIDEINQKHTNEKYLKEITLPEGLVGTTDLKEALSNRETVLIVIPTVGIRSIAKQVNALVDEPKLFIHASKGLEQESYHRISEVLAEEIDEEKSVAIAVLSGPSHAEEVAVQDLTSVTSASKNEEAAEKVQKLFMNDYFRVYRNEDIIGVELGAALKNIIALGAGALNGLGYGDNAIAALVTRGSAEIARLGVALGAEVETFMGLSGVGDLIVTCTSPHSRNWQAGKLIGEGKNLEEIQDTVGMAIEGLSTVIAAKELAEVRGVDMPITQAIYQVVYEDVDVEEAVVALMRRKGKAE